MKNWITSTATATACALGLSAGTATADAISDFYGGKQITFIVGAGSGGGFGINARIFAAYYGKYIPGNPTIVVQHMQGAGGIKAANFVYNVAPKDGSVIHMPVGSTVQNNLLYPKKTRYDSSKFRWIGSIADQPYEFSVWHTATIRSIQDAKKTQVFIGAGTGRSSLYQIPRLMNAVLGTKFNIITGYKGSRGVDLAMERGEVQGRTTAYASAQSRTPHWVEGKKLIRLMQIGPAPIAALSKLGVPRFIDLVKSEEHKKMVAFLHTTMKLGRSVNTPPGVPSVRVAALRKAFDATMKDPAVRRDLAKRKMPFNPSSGADLQAFVGKAMKTSPELVAQMRKLLKPPKRKKNKKK